MAGNVRGVGNQTHYFRVNPSICQRTAKKGREHMQKKEGYCHWELGKVMDVPDREAMH